MRAAVFAVAGSLITIGGDSVAAPISVDDPGNSFEVYHFRTNSGSNSAGFGSSDTITFGLTNVRPNGKGEDAGTPIFDGNGVQVPPTTGTAVQNGVAVDLEFEGDTNTPNLYSGGLSYDSNLTGQWTITLQNEADVLVVETPELGDVGIPERVTGVQLIQSGDPTTPTFTWQNVDPNADDMRLTVFDLSKRDLVGQAQAVYYSPTFTSGEKSFTIPEGELEEGGLYAVRVESRILRDGGFGPSGQSLVGANLSVNRTWFDFTTGQVDTGDGIYLPEISFSEENTPIFNFNNIVAAGLVEYYDPFVAIGYDYMIGEGNPLFASFILPEIGDDLFELHLWNGSEFVFEADVAALDKYSFGGSGVERFRILGIETSAGLDPDDTTAFVTGLSFAANGQFTGTMTPISVFVDDPNPVPLPATLPMLLLGVAGLRFARHRTKKNCALLRT